MDLSEMRVRIDKINKEIAALLRERFEITGAVAEYKRENNLPVYVPGREREILDKMETLSGDKIPPRGLRLLYAIIMDLTKLGEYKIYPKELSLPAASTVKIRAEISGGAQSLCRCLSSLAAYDTHIVSISSRLNADGKLVTEMELQNNSQIQGALSVISDTADKFDFV